MGHEGWQGSQRHEEIIFLDREKLKRQRERERDEDEDDSCLAVGTTSVCV